MGSDLFETCPTGVVEASAETVWKLCTEPSLIDTWCDTRLVEGPGRALVEGDVLRFKTGPGRLFEVKWKVGAPKPPRELPLRIELPFGLLNEEVITVTPLGERRCRVTFQ